MRLARQQRSCAKEISLINVVEDLVVDAVCRLRNSNAAFPYQVERIARFAFTKNYFTGFLSQHAKFWRNALDDVGINSFEKPIIAKSLYGSAPRGRFHSDQHQLAIDEPSGREPSIWAYFTLSRTPRIWSTISSGASGFRRNPAIPAFINRSSRSCRINPVHRTIGMSARISSSR